jgi:hypothetical protein
MSHNSLDNYYKVLFSLAHHHKYSIADLENLIVFEIDIYLKLIADYHEQLRVQAEQDRLMREAIERKASGRRHGF